MAANIEYDHNIPFIRVWSRLRTARSKQKHPTGTTISSKNTTCEHLSIFLSGVQKKKVLHKIHKKMHKKMKITYQRAKNLVRVQQHYSISFYEKIFFYS